jgi:acetolactate synthase small subunit
MATLTKVSPYRSGPPRFGNRPHNIDTSVKTYQLTPEQLERYKNGEKLDDILKEDETMKNKIDLTVEEYVKMKKQGMSDAEIAQAKGLTEKQLYSWKYFRKKRISEMEEKLQKQEPVETVDETNQEASTQEVIAYAKYEEVVAERDELKRQLEELKLKQPFEVKYINVDYKTKCEELSRDYEKLVHEAEQKAKELEHWKELFETAMADKERLHKENLILENQIQRLKEVNDELTAKNERYFADLMRLEQEVKGLRLYALQKLHIDVYGA